MPPACAKDNAKIASRNRNGLGRLASALMMSTLSTKNDTTPLTIPLVLVDETVIATVGEAARYIAALPPVYKQWMHWQTAAQMVIRAAHDSDYVQAATMTFQIALMQDACLSRPHLIDPY